MTDVVKKHFQAAANRVPMWITVVLGGVLVFLSVVGIILSPEDLATTLFNFSILFLAGVFPVRRFVMLYTGSTYDMQTWTFRYILAGAGLFFFIGAWSPIGVWNYGTLVLFTSAIVYGTWWSWQFSKGRAYETPTKIVTLVAASAIIIWLSVGVPWGQVQGPAGVVGATVEETLTTVGSTASTAGEFTYNTLTHSEQICRVRCVMEHGGLGGLAFTPPQDINACVRDCMNVTETKSEELTDPVEVEIQEPRVQPSRNEVSVTFALRNKEAFDRRGRPIFRTARDMEVRIEWRRNNDEVAERTLDRDSLQNGEEWLVEETFSYASESLWSANNETTRDMLIPGRPGYTISVDVSYTYDGEAAFTESTRWRSGNNILTVWDPEAWRDLSPDERERWVSDNCEEVNLFGNNVPLQRSAAVSTPIVPVMWADCGSSLFLTFEGEVPISIGATGTENPNSEFEVEEFEILGARTDCHDAGATTRELSGWSELYSTQELQEGVGWGVSPHTIRREVNIAGERATISCLLEMEIRVHSDETTRSVILPDFRSEEERQ